MSMPAAAHVQTVTGPADPEALGVTLTHEHVFLAMWATDGQGFVGQLDDEEVLAAELVERGVGDHVLLSQDVGQVPELRSRGGRGYTYLAETFLPALRAAGVDDDVVRGLTVDNPRRWLTIGGDAARRPDAAEALVRSA